MFDLDHSGYPFYYLRHGARPCGSYDIQG
jgi:hypothetical protein